MSSVIGMSDRPIDSQMRLMQTGERLLHLIYTEQLSRPLLDRLFETADKARNLYASRLGATFLKECLPNRRALLYFVQPSTRTFLSFHAAATLLGLSCVHINQPSTSSESKGESPLDSVQTFAMYNDLIVIRHPDAGFAAKCVERLMQSEVSKHIISAGSGMEQHPTQGILDVYTLQREFGRKGGVDGRRVLIVGDLARGRAARAFIHLFAHYDDVQIDLAGPAQMSITDEMQQYLSEKGVTVRESENMDDFIRDADAIYMTRIQDEYDDQFPVGEVDYERYSLTKERLGMMKANCAILHPLPRRSEIPVSVDRDPRSRYWEQVENGMWARVALIAHMLNCDLRIRTA
ncbi:MAG: aspartate carbamoyltransferase [Planctomycetota bacterium]|nr:aspartate carbamoyltransferase [Planctomycetota bacterium]